jgi:hypothetical protein
MYAGSADADSAAAFRRAEAILGEGTGPTASGVPENAHGIV